MSSPFIAEIRIFAGNFAPFGWATCDGQLVAISQNTALFSILGTNYGGNGTSTFGLPNLRGSAPLGNGRLQGGSQYVLGEVGGSANVTLLQTEMPSHTHALTGDGSTSAFGTPSSSVVFGASKGARPGVVDVYGPADANNPAQMAAGSIGPVGNTFPHDNMQPYLALTFIIALQGVFPSRN
jgi:microcystin-dependent protein